MNAMRSKVSSPLVDYIDPSKISKGSLAKVQNLVDVHRNDYLRMTTNHCPVQLDSETYKLLRKMKNKYDVYFYDAIKESLLLMQSVLK